MEPAYMVRRDTASETKRGRERKDYTACAVAWYMGPNVWEQASVLGIDALHEVQYQPQQCWQP